MRYVSQKHKNGCAVASLAMLTGIGYDKVLKKLHPKLKHRQQLVGTTLEQTLRYLYKVKSNFRVVFNKDLKKLKNNAYLSVTTKTGGRHAMVWDAKNQKLIDPQLPRTYYLTRAYAQKHTNFIIEILD
ncbi:MAG: hypothetical protein AB7I18_13940 [Candidatus Berkiella sp.]